MTTSSRHTREALLLIGFICLSSFCSSWSTTTASAATAAAPGAGHTVEDFITKDFAKYQRVQPKVIRSGSENLVAHQDEEGGPNYRTGHGRLKREIRNINNNKNKNGHASHFTLELSLVPSSSASGAGAGSSSSTRESNAGQTKTHLVDLQLNKELIPDGYFVRTQEKGQPLVNRPHPNLIESQHCHYHGKVRGQPNSWAALSTCDGLRGLVFDGSELHYFEPPSTKPNSTTTTASANNFTEVLHFLESDRTRNLSCGHSHTAGDNAAAAAHGAPFSFGFSSLEENEEDDGGSVEETGHQSRAKRDVVGGSSSLQVPHNSNAKSRYVELVLVVDNRKFNESGKNLNTVIQRSQEIANIVNVLYAPLNIFIALVGVVVWTEADEIQLQPKGDETLANFLRYRRERLLKDHPNDNAQLLTAFEFEEGVVGKAMQGPICSFKYSGGVNSDYKSVLGVVATTVAHELGHNFGLSHDTEACKCDGPNSKCIMSASSSSNRTAHWSSCSVEAIEFAFKHGMDYCLRNKPKSLFKGPICGNGFTEPGEECDCGHVEHCDNPCCNAHTCKLHANATCGSGECCDYSICHPKAGGTVCRKAKSQCDLAEYCNGDNEYCPDDVHRQNGADCETSNGLAQCYSGECKTHTDQCKLLWGPTGVTSMDACYQKNVNGSRYGHCGYNLATEKYTRCQKEDVKCGVLQCRHEQEKLQFGYEQVAILSTFFLNTGVGIFPCRSVTTDFGLTDVDPGLTPSGARCGENKMCVDQKCVPIAAVLTPLKCPDNCNGNGYCNSKGHCHCDEGFGGESCDSGGYGGSVDSGPILNPYSGSSIFAKALYVTFLGFIPLIGVISFYLYYAGDNFKKLCKRGQAVTRIQARSKPYQNGGASGGAGGSSRSGYGRRAETTNSQPLETSTSSGSIGTAADDFFGQYKGFSLSPVRNDPKQPNGDARNHSNLAPTSKQQPSTIFSPTMSTPPPPPYSSSAAIHTQVLLKNDRPSLKENFLQKGMTRVSWAHPIAHTTPISPEEGNNVDDESANNSDTPLYENTKELRIGSPRSPGAGKARPLSSPDALQDTKMFDPSAEPNGHGVSSSKKEVGGGGGLSGFFGGSTSALSRLASAFPFVKNSFMKNSTSTESTTNNGGSANGLNTRAGITRQKSFNRDSIQISQPILHNSNQVEAKMPNLVCLVPALSGDVVDGPTKPTTHDQRYGNTTSSAGHRYTNVPLQDSPPPSSSVHDPVVKATSNFIGKSVVAKPFSRSLVRLKNESPEISPSPQPPAPATQPAVVKAASPSHPVKPITSSRPTVTRAQSMSHPNNSNRNSIGSNPNYNSLRRARPSAPPPKPPEDYPAAPPPPSQATRTNSTPSLFTSPATKSGPVTPPKPNNQEMKGSQSPPPAVTSATAAASKASRYKYPIGGRFTSRDNPTLLTLNTKPTNTTTTTSLFAPIAKIDDMSSPSSVGSCADIMHGSNGGGKPENIYDVIADEMEEDTQQSPAGGEEERIETLSTGSSENGGGLLSEIISEISSRNRDSIYNSMDRRKLRKEKQQQKKAELGRDKKTPSPKNAGTGRSASAIPKELPMKPQPSLFASTTIAASATASAPSPRITINPGFEKILKPSSPKSSFQKITPPPPPTITPPMTSLYTKPTLPTCTTHSTTSPAPTTPWPSQPPLPLTPAAAATSPPTTSASKPTCAVNGIPKITTSPSYVAKINYFSTLGSTGKPNDPNSAKLMKPITSLSQSISPASCSMLGDGGSPDLYEKDSTIYAPGQLSTIRRSRPYMSNHKSYLSNVGVGDESANNKNNNISSGSNNSTGMYARPVATPKVPYLRLNSAGSSSRSNSIDSSGSSSNDSSSSSGNCPHPASSKVGRSNSINKESSSSNSASSNGSSSDFSSKTLPHGSSSVAGSGGVGGYKSFHPYLNRPLTFSTFRPTASFRQQQQKELEQGVSDIK